jgi:hypothetical protein
MSVAQQDGHTCGPNLISVRGGFLAQSCGDSGVSSGATCGGTPDYRENCTRCGDGIVDSGEDCDHGAANGALTSRACPATCVAACEHGFVDFGERCDDGNANLRDGCADCQVQRWSSALVVSGAVEPRAGEETVIGEPISVTVDPLGRVVIVDTVNNRIRRVELDGTITTIAGTGEFGCSGDGGPASSAALAYPEGIAVDPLGLVLIGDMLNHRIPRREPDGTILTIAGSGDETFASDGGLVTRAALSRPSGVTVDLVGRVLIADKNNSRLRGFGRIQRIDLGGVVDVVVGFDAASPDAFGLARFAPLLDEGRHRRRRRRARDRRARHFAELPLRTAMHSASSRSTGASSSLRCGSAFQVFVVRQRDRPPR